MAYVIECLGEPKLWIREAPTGSTPMGLIVDVTYQIKNAKRFACLEDANHEILHLGLAGMWKPREVGGWWGS